MRRAVARSEENVEGELETVSPSSVPENVTPKLEDDMLSESKLADEECSDSATEQEIEHDPSGEEQTRIAEVLRSRIVTADPDAGLEVQAANVPAHVVGKNESAAFSVETAEKGPKSDGAQKHISDWSVGDVILWLSSTGLGKYVKVFQRENIAGDVLLECDREDLKAMGLVLGDIKRLEKAIEALRKKADSLRNTRSRSAPPLRTEPVKGSAVRQRSAGACMRASNGEADESGQEKELPGLAIDNGPSADAGAEDTSLPTGTPRKKETIGSAKTRQPRKSSKTRMKAMRASSEQATQVDAAKRMLPDKAGKMLANAVAEAANLCVEEPEVEESPLRARRISRCH